MGIGDNVMATGLARGFSRKGQWVGFGDGVKILWDHNSPSIFRGNPNIAPPGCESSAELVWIPFYKGNRLYNTNGGDRWIWNYDFKAVPGELFFDEKEIVWARVVAAPKPFAIIEPCVPEIKSVAKNKDWGLANYQAVADALMREGMDVIQLTHTGAGSQRRLGRGVIRVDCPSYRHAAALLSLAQFYVGPEGGLHHATAAVGRPAVVLFGGFIPPAVTGYDAHRNLTGGAEACGMLKPCDHCKQALARISPDEVLEAAREWITDGL